MARYSIRDLIALTIIVALLVCFLIEARHNVRLTSQRNKAEEQVFAQKVELGILRGELEGMKRLLNEEMSQVK